MQLDLLLLDFFFKSRDLCFRCCARLIFFSDGVVEVCHCFVKNIHGIRKGGNQSVFFFALPYQNCILLKKFIDAQTKVLVLPKQLIDVQTKSLVLLKQFIQPFLKFIVRSKDIEQQL